MGVREYWLVDPVGGYHDPQVQGFQLVDGAYEQLPSEEGSEGMVAVWSPLLQLELRFADGQLRACCKSPMAREIHRIGSRKPSK